VSRIEYRHGLVIGKFYPPHLGHEYLIRTAARHCGAVTVGVLGASVESISMHRRAAWLKESFADFANVRVVAELDDVRIDYESSDVWDEHVAVMRRAIARADREYGAVPVVDAVFTSESYGDELARRFSAAHVCLDLERQLVPVSGTRVRSDPAALWDAVSPAVRAGLCLRVVVVGAESTGTTTLSHDLAEALRRRGGVWERTGWVGEYGREYSANLLALKRAVDRQACAEDIEWRTADFPVIAREQCRLEEAAARIGSPVLVCDTDALATCVWHERYVGRSDVEVERIAAHMPPRALYLLTSHEGVPFEDDGLRDGEHLRSWMTDRFRAVLEHQSIPWLELRGSPAERCDAALRAVDELLKRSWQFALPLEQRSC
jgi:NadR type nicotinamide-nucleotide adenylyltransferase